MPAGPSRYAAQLFAIREIGIQMLQLLLEMVNSGEDSLLFSVVYIERIISKLALLSLIPV